MVILYTGKQLRMKADVYRFSITLIQQAMNLTYTLDEVSLMYTRKYTQEFS
jgi:hypothetical protein